MKYVALYFMMGVIVIAIGSNIERGCKETQSTLIQCIGFVVIWPAVAVIGATAQSNFPCKGMNL